MLASYVDRGHLEYNFNYVDFYLNKAVADKQIMY